MSEVRSSPVLFSQHPHAVSVQRLQVSSVGYCGDDLPQDQDTFGEMVLNDLSDEPSEEWCFDAEPPADVWDQVVQAHLDNGPQDSQGNG